MQPAAARSRPLPLPTYLLIFVLSISSFCQAEIIEYRNSVKYGQPTYIEIPKFGKNDVPHWNPGNGRNKIDASNLQFEAVCDISSEGCSGVVDILVFKSLDTPGKTWFDYWPTDDLCCSQEMVESGKCKQADVDSIYIPTEISETFKKTVTVSSDGEVTLENESELNLVIKHSGMYVILMSMCKEQSSSVKVSGFVESINPYGYLPAYAFGNLPFYGAISLVYVFVGLTWILMCICYKEELLSLQYWITGVLALGMLETTLLFSHFIGWNDTGLINISLMMSGLVFGVIKRSLSRVVVLMVAMGYGIVRPSIGEDMKRVLYLGFCYLMLSLIYTITSNLPSNAKYVGDPEFENMFALVVMLLAVVDTTFYMWTISSLSNIIITLDARKQSAKLLLYHRFRYVLFLALTFAVVWALYGAYLVSGDNLERDWGQSWTIDALSEITYLIVFVAIVFLWAPSRNSQRYMSYVELSQLGDGDDDETSNEISQNGSAASRIDAEYGGKLDEDDPFQGTGALDPAMAIMKKN